MNASTAVILLILIGTVGLAARKLIRDKKAGRGCCGSCNSCAGCHRASGRTLADIKKSGEEEAAH